MAKFYAKPDMNFEIKMILTEEEANALADLAAYDIDLLIKIIEDYVSEKYIEKNGKGLRSFLFSLQRELHKELSKIDKAKKFFEE